VTYNYLLVNINIESRVCGLSLPKA